jgi:hypothetical protein
MGSPAVFYLQNNRFSFYLHNISGYGIYKRKKKQTPKRVMSTMRRRTTKSACKICISCGEPTADGKMQVEMTCEGDEILAAYLLQNAQSLLDEKMNPASKISPIENSSVIL